MDLIGTKTLDAVKQKVAEAVASAAPGESIRGRGWDQNDWEGFDLKRQKFPTAADLDGIAPNNPVVLTRIDGHAIWVNTRAMKIAEVDGRTRVPGGEIVKVRGRPSGIFVDNAMALIGRHVPTLTGAQLEQALLLAQDECIRAGLTQVQDMGMPLETIAAMKKLDADGRLKLRVYVMHDWTEPDSDLHPRGGANHPASRLALPAHDPSVKLMVDGALGSRGAALLAPYSDDRRNKGHLNLPPDEIERRVRMAESKGFQVATHAIGDLGNRTVLDIYEKVFAGKAWRARPHRARAGARARRHRSLRQARDHRLHPAHPRHQRHALGGESPRPRADQGRVRLAVAADQQRDGRRRERRTRRGRLPNPRPLCGDRTRKNEFGEPEEGWYADQRMTPTQALDAFTKGANYAAFQEDHLGRIEKGYTANLTVLDRNPLTANESDLVATRATMTIIGGEIAYEKPPQVATSTTP